MLGVWFYNLTFFLPISWICPFISHPTTVWFLATADALPGMTKETSDIIIARSNGHLQSWLPWLILLGHSFHNQTSLPWFLQYFSVLVSSPLLGALSGHLHNHFPLITLEYGKQSPGDTASPLILNTFLGRSLLLTTYAFWHTNSKLQLCPLSWIPDP